jgi:tRNA threonylcarbamoyl adenosine modification protein (Sua5/YciO/YrdC/YwlC family)
MLLEINPHTPEPRKIRRAVDALEAGQVIGYPTDTVYGLGCDLFVKKAVDRLYQIKGMPRSQQLAFVCRDLSEVGHYAVMDDKVFRILREYLPGPYCFLLEATREVPKVVQSPRKVVGVRIPSHPVTLALVQELGRPIISTTASRSGTEAYPDPKEIATEFRGLSLVLDAGPCGTVPTSVVDLTGPTPRIVRRGAGDVGAFET